MDVFHSLAVPEAHIAKHFVLGLDQCIVSVLSHQKLFLLKETFDLIQGNLTLHVPSHNVDMLVWPNSPHIKVRHG